MSRAPLQNADEAKATMSVHDSPARVDIERELEGRMLLNEQRRSAVLACILAAIVVGRGSITSRMGSRRTNCSAADTYSL